MYAYDQEVVEQTENTVHMNVGPSHPAMHGTLRVKMEVKGERIVKAEQEIGYLHTGFEKLGEYRTYNQFITLTDRLNYFSPLNNNIGFAVAVEELIGLEPPRRCQVIRTLLAELSRLADHSLCVGAMAMDLGAFTSILWTFVEREKLYDVFEAVTGTRLTTSYTRVGGVAFDLPDGFEKRVTAILDSMTGTVEKLRNSFYKNRIFLDRTQGIGVISKQDLEAYGITGPMARASGVKYDLRKYRPYLIYNELKFEMPVYAEGDSLARYKVRLDEMDQSIALVRQALKLLEPGPISALDQKHALPDKTSTYSDMESMIHHFKMIMPGEEHGLHAPVTDLYSATEAPNGELGFHLVSDGTSNPWRIRIRPPSFINYPILSRLLEGAMLSDLVSILSSFNIIAGGVGSMIATKKNLSPESLRRFHDMVDDYPNKRSMLMMTLRLIEEEFGCIDDAGMEIAADLCGVAASHVQGMVTFYTHFKRPAHGKHRFMVCATLMCALDGNTNQALKQIHDTLGINPGERTHDGLFSCEKVECLADRDRPPVLQEDFEHFCSMRGKTLEDYLTALLKKEGKTPEDYRGTPAALMDLRVSVLPAHYNFEDETSQGARHFDDKDPYFKSGEAHSTTTIPGPLKTPFTAPVADGANMNGAQHG